MATDKLLTLINVSKAYLHRGKVLDNISIEINKGETIAVTGPSGSGKTTLLNIIGLLDKPDSGTVEFLGDAVSDFDADQSARYRNEHIGFVFQDHLLLPYLTISENIALPLLARKDTRKSETEAYLRKLMEITSIYELHDKYPDQVSGGEAQRAALVRALAGKPSVLLADEPTGSLDSKNAGILGELLRDMNSETGITVILVTHSEEIARKMNSWYILSEGKLIPKR